MGEPDPAADDHYERLGVDPDASSDAIERRGREVMRRIRDETDDPAVARRHHYRIQEALDVLTDEEARAAYDASRESATTDEPGATSEAAARGVDAVDEGETTGVDAGVAGDDRTDASAGDGRPGEVPIAIDVEPVAVEPGELLSVRTRRADDPEAAVGGVTVVSTTGDEVTTGDDGEGTLRLSAVDEERDVRLRARRDGVVVATEVVRLVPPVASRSLAVEIVGDEPVLAGESVRLRVIDDAGDPVPGARAVVTGHGSSRTVGMDADGTAELTFEEPGERHVVVESPGRRIHGGRVSYEPTTTDVTVERREEASDSPGTDAGPSGADATSADGPGTGERAPPGDARSEPSADEQARDGERLRLQLPDYQSRTVEAGERLTVEVRDPDGKRVAGDVEVTTADGDLTAPVRTGQSELVLDDPGEYDLVARMRSTAGPADSEPLTVEVEPETTSLAFRAVGEEFETHEPIRFRLETDVPNDVGVSVRAVGRDRSARAEDGRAELTFTEPGRVEVEARVIDDGDGSGEDASVTYQPASVTIDVREADLRGKDRSTSPQSGHATRDEPPVAAPTRVGLFALGLVVLAGGVVAGGSLPLLALGGLLVAVAILLSLA